VKGRSSVEVGDAADAGHSSCPVCGPAAAPAAAARAAWDRGPAHAQCVTHSVFALSLSASAYHSVVSVPHSMSHHSQPAHRSFAKLSRHSNPTRPIYTQQQ